MKMFKKFLSGIVILLFFAPVVSAASSTYAKTKYPIVLIHGLTGAKSMLGVVEYWYGIPAKLKSNGNDQVFVATVSSVSGEDFRVAQAEQFIDGVLKKTGAEKVNLIGHSQGGFTARGYAALHPDKVASITTVGSPHHGSPIADVIAVLTSTIEPVLPSVRDAIVWVMEAFGWTNGMLNGQKLDQDALGALHLLSSRGADEFARNVHGEGLSASCKGERSTYAFGTCKNENGETVAYGYPMFSWTGKGAPINIFRSGSDLLDPSAYMMDTLRIFMKNLLGSGENDGMVPVCSSLFGEVISADYYWSHLDEVNQVLGLVPSGADPRMAYVIHANRLKALGL